MMTKTTSAKMIIIKQLALVPVFLGSLLLFSQKVAARGASVAAKAPNQKTSYNKVAKEGPQVVFSANYTPMHSAKYNAPNRIIAAYHAILKKYKLSIDSEKRVHRAGPFSESDQKQLIALYEQMSSEQQDNQFVSFSKNRPPFPSVVPTEQQLNKWKDAKVYHIWVNNKRVRNDELNKHNASDFDWYYEDGISSTNYKYAVQMMTKSFHADDSKRAKAIMDGYQLSYNLDGDL